MTKVTILCGGVGGARMASGFDALDDVDTTAVVNVGDDETIYGLHVCPDIDTVIYTLAGIAGPLGWGIDGDASTVMGHLERFPIDTWFNVGDRDLATHLFRTARLNRGWTLSQVTTAQTAVFGVGTTVLPASDDPVRTEVHETGGEWMPFQDYFVRLAHSPAIDNVRFGGIWGAVPGPGVIDAIVGADLVVIAPSNPPLSIWPILAIEGIAETVGKSPRTVAISPLLGGRPIKGPADRVMAGLGLPPGTGGVVAAYEGLLDELVVDLADKDDVGVAADVEIYAANTRIDKVEAAADLASFIINR